MGMSVPPSPLSFVIRASSCLQSPRGEEEQKLTRKHRFDPRYLYVVKLNKVFLTV